MRYELESELASLENEFGAFEERRYVSTESAATTGLRQVADTTPSPFRWVCRIRVQMAKGHSYGTGILVSPWHVLTAAHVIYPPQEPYATTDIEVGPGYSARSKPRLRANGWAVDPRWNVRNCMTAGADLGLIRLAQPVSPAVGFWKLTQFPPGSLTGRAFLLAGYPSRPSDRDATVLFRSNGVIRGSVVLQSCTASTAEGRLLPTLSEASQLMGHDAPSEGSMSGGPICLADGGIPKLVAVHTGTLSNGALKKAVLLVSSVQARIRDWINGSLRPLTAKLR